MVAPTRSVFFIQKPPIGPGRLARQTKLLNMRVLPHYGGSPSSTFYRQRNSSYIHPRAKVTREYYQHYGSVTETFSNALRCMGKIKHPSDIRPLFHLS
ncbi:hypothetical protein FNV43_RR18393 [Rhamnella rubrinervis]|uniref:Uncharacterized protein n=1 Tax=Rhamnella rubrinervis TaxID=2594499 RepID=A0A8K0E671_9ROSA|nr:hypothetical protein FNV43_RR18393 [Rhamnella rubrinervis]